MVDTFASSQVVEGNPGDVVLEVTHGSDRAFIVEFYSREVVDENLTREKGREIVRAVDYCRKQAPGDTRSVWDAPATDSDKARWPKHWQAYQKGLEGVIGTPIDSWPILGRDAKITLKNHGYKTVEQIAGVTDGSLATMPSNLAVLIQRAQKHAERFIQNAEAGEAERKLEDELKKRDAQIDVLTKQIQQLSAQMEKDRTERLAGPIHTPEETAPIPQPSPETLTQAPFLPPVEATNTGLDALPELEPMQEPVPVAESTLQRKRKLSDEQIAEIQGSSETLKVLSERYGVSVPTIAKYRKAAA